MFHPKYSAIMKKFLSVLFLNIIAVAAFSQQPEQVEKHLEFMGEPICGTLNNFVNKMVKKGFTFSEITQDGTAILKGEYEGYKNCDIYIYSVQNGKKVNNVAVSFPYQDTWSALSDDYYNLKKTLTKRYGQPDISIEVFENEVPYDLKMLYVETDRCDFKSTFNRDNGVIALVINHVFFENKHYSNVRIIYMDQPNYGSQKQKEEEKK